MVLTKSAKSIIKKNTRKVESPWKGPSADGVTQSMICSYLVCPERFRVKAIEGWQPIDSFQKAMEYGNLWHICEENFAAGKPYEEDLRKYATELARKYPLAQVDIEKWWNICLLQFPIYVDYWKKQPDVKKRIPICQEKCFGIRYELPSGRDVTLRGKFDSVDRISKRVWLQENKTKGDIKEAQLERQLTFDIQTMYYLIALLHDPEIKGTPAGIRYNVIRRPLAGGKGSIRPHKATKTKEAETMDHYYDRLKAIIEEDASEAEGDCTFFMRWKLEVSREEMDRFKRLTMNPILENLYDDYEWWDYCKDEKCDPFDYSERSQVFSYHQARHYVHPFGVYNVLNEGGSTDMDEYLRAGSTVGLERAATMFPEL